MSHGENTSGLLKKKRKRIDGLEASLRTRVEIPHIKSKQVNSFGEKPCCNRYVQSGLSCCYEKMTLPRQVGKGRLNLDV